MVVKDIEREDIEFICKVLEIYAVDWKLFIYFLYSFPKDTELSSYCQSGSFLARIPGIGWSSWICPYWFFKSCQGITIFFVIIKKFVTSITMVFRSREFKMLVKLCRLSSEAVINLFWKKRPDLSMMPFALSVVSSRKGITLYTTWIRHFV